MDRQIERMLQEEIREKRKAGSGSFHKRGKGVKHGLNGALKTPSYFMSNKEKKNLNSEVTVTMYETIIPKEEFELKDEQMQKMLLTRWREIHSNSYIMKEMGIVGSGTFHKLVAKLDIPKKKRIEPNRKPRTRKGITTKEMTPQINIQSEESKSYGITDTIQSALSNLENVETVQQQPIKLLQTGLQLEYNGIYNPDQLSKIFTKLQLITDGEKCKYYLSISLSERPN